MKTLAIASGIFFALCTSSSFAACERATSQGRCVDQWGNLVPTDIERRFDENGVPRINLANEAAAYASGRWYFQNDYSGNRRRGSSVRVPNGYSEGNGIDYSRRGYASR